MMLPPLPLLTSLAVHASIAAIGLLFIRVFVATTARPFALRVLAAAALVLLAAHAAWAVGLRHYPTSYWGAAIASCGMPVGALVVASLPFAWLVRIVLARLVHPRSGSPLSVQAAADPEPTLRSAPLPRRVFVQGVSSAIPLAAASTGVLGFVADARGPALREVRVDIAQLHPDLRGLVILHLSDLHLGCTRSVADLERVFLRLERARPDLVVFTGDLADDVTQIAPALRLAHELAPPLGVYAALGNHEYLHDIAITRALYEKSPVPLLVNEGMTLAVGRARLHLVGVDDPVTVHADIGRFMDRALDDALDGAPSDAFRLALCHRPEGFASAARRGVDLMLSGHTHGGQIGFNGKSAFSPIWPERYLWGSYRRGPSYLYTTSGFGDWYPFRLGCPTEAPLLVLAG
jgi:predicted MPP superfamily phosphohydrolase